MCFNIIDKGIDSLNLWGPYEGLVAQIPPNLDNIHDLGAAILFKCFLGPLAIFYLTLLKDLYQLSINNNYLILIIISNFYYIAIMEEEIIDDWIPLD